MHSDPTTLFESLFPLLALQKCISTARGSSNGPRFSAADRTTAGAFEIRVVTLPQANVDGVSGGVSLIDCKRRAEALLKARSSNRSVSLPEDVYAVDHQPVREEKHNGAPTTGTLSPSCSIVSVARRLGPTLGDICYGIGQNGLSVDGDDGSLLRERRKSSRKLITNNTTRQDDDEGVFTPTMVSLQVLERILDAISKHVAIHLTLPTHGNISLQSVACGAPLDVSRGGLNAADWVVTDWALDPRSVEATTNVAASSSPGGSPPRGYTSALEKSRRVQKQWLRVLRTAFLGSEAPENKQTSSSRSPKIIARHIVGMPRQGSLRRTPGDSKPPYLSVVQEDGLLLARHDLELLIIAAVTKGAVALVGIEDIATDDDEGDVSATKLRRRASSSVPGGNVSDADTLCSLEERAYAHEVALTQERLAAAAEHSTTYTKVANEGAFSPSPVKYGFEERGPEYYALRLPKRRPSPRRTVPDLVVASDEESRQVQYRHSFAIKRDEVAPHLTQQSGAEAPLHADATPTTTTKSNDNEGEAHSSPLASTFPAVTHSRDLPLRSTPTESAPAASSSTASNPPQQTVLSQQHHHRESVVATPGRTAVSTQTPPPSTGPNAQQPKPRAGCAKCCSIM